MGVVKNWITGYTGTPASIDDLVTNFPTLVDGVHDVMVSHVNSLAEAVIQLETIQSTLSALTTQDEGSPLTTNTSVLNFTGGGVVATNVGSVVSISIPGTSLHDLQAAYDIGNTITLAAATPVAITTSGVGQDGITITDGVSTTTLRGGQILAADGTDVAPGWSFGAQSNTGLYRYTTSGLAMTFGGGRTYNLNAAYIAPHNPSVPTLGTASNRWLATYADTYYAESGTTALPSIRWRLGAYGLWFTSGTTGISVGGSNALSIRYSLTGTSSTFHGLDQYASVSIAPGGGAYYGHRMQIGETAYDTTVVNYISRYYVGGLEKFNITREGFVSAGIGGTVSGGTTQAGYGFVGFPNTGMYYISATTTLAWMIGGAGQIAVDTTAFYPPGATRDLGKSTNVWGNAYLGTLLTSDGTAAAPSHSFRLETSTGLWRSGTSQIGVSLGGTNRYVFATGSLSPATAATYNLGSSGVPWNTVFAYRLEQPVGNTNLFIRGGFGSTLTESVYFTNALSLNASTAIRQSFLSGDITIAQSGTALGYTGIRLNVTETSTVGAANYLMDLQVGGVSQLYVYNDGRLVVGDGIDVASQLSISSKSDPNTGITIGRGADLLEMVTGGLRRLYITVTSITAERNFLPGLPNVYTIGSNSTRWLVYYASAGSIGTPSISIGDNTTGFYQPAAGSLGFTTSGLVAATGDEIAFDFATTVNKLTSGNYTGIKLNVTETSAPGTANYLLDLQIGGTTRFNVSANTGDVLVYGGRLTLAEKDGINRTGLGTNTAGQMTLYGAGSPRFYVNGTTFGPFISNTYNLGVGGLRFKQLFLSSGTAADPAVSIGATNTGIWESGNVVGIVSSGTTIGRFGNMNAVGNQVEVPQGAAGSPGLTFPLNGGGDGIYQAASGTVGITANFAAAMTFSSTAITGYHNVVPDTTITRDLGTSSLFWRTAYIYTSVYTSEVLAPATTLGAKLTGRITTGAGSGVTLGNQTAFTASSGNQIATEVLATANQSSTAGFLGLHINITGTSVGSGGGALLAGTWSGVSQFFVGSTGIVQARTHYGFLDGAGNDHLSRPAASQLALTANSEAVIVDNDSTVPSFRPDVDNTWTLGESALRWADLFAVQTTTGDLNLKGLHDDAHWTVNEDRTGIYVHDRVTGKKYKLLMEEVTVAPEPLPVK